MPLLKEGGAFIRRNRWVPVTATLLIAAAFVAALLIGANPIATAAMGAALVVSSYISGYSARALKHMLWPPLNHLQRSSYAKVWDSIAISTEAAAVAVSGQAHEDELRRSAQQSVANLLELAEVGPGDDVLEIGCGIARIGWEVAPHCRCWTGGDISANMIHFAAERIKRLGGKENIRLVRLRSVGLSEFPAASFHVVYITNVIPHLDEIDRWIYVQEAFRVLRPGGRLFLDNVDLESDAGWTMFANDAKRFLNLERPPYMPRYSTAPELTAYAARAGFGKVLAHRRPPLVVVTAVKRNEPA